MSKLNNKVAVVTGGNSGIGLATAKLFAAEGAKVVITGRNADTLKAAQQEIKGEVLAVKSDTAATKDIDALVQQTVQKFGKVDVLFLNAGVFKAAPVLESDEKLYDEIFNINVKGLFFTLQKFIPHLNAGASIVLNASTVIHMGMAGASLYSASKAAVRSFARTLSAELAGQGIRVNVISPGPIETPIYDRLGMLEDVKTTVKEGLYAGTTLKRMGTADEMARVVLFLASADSAYVIGEEILADGGMNTI